ncbi:MAG: hypothetical protein PT941_04180 [Bacillales bacterium]|nr:hypothetical protein [Bacillales bacterium]
MKNFYVKAMLTIDLWAIIVSSIVFTSLYFIEDALFLNQLIIVICSIASFNILFIIIFILKNSKQNRLINKSNNK